MNNDQLEACCLKVENVYTLEILQITQSCGIKLRSFKLPSPANKAIRWVRLQYGVAGNSRESSQGQSGKWPSS